MDILKVLPIFSLAKSWNIGLSSSSSHITNKGKTCQIHYISNSLFSTTNYLRFSSIEICLDENLANTDIFQDLTQCIFHGLSRPQDRHTADFFRCNVLALIWNALRCFNSYILRRQEKESRIINQYKTVNY